MADADKKKMTLSKLMECQRAGGVLDEEPNWRGLRYQTWDDYVNAEYDLSDPAMVEFVTSWRKFLDAKMEFSNALMTAFVRVGVMDVDTFG